MSPHDPTVARASVDDLLHRARRNLLRLDPAEAHLACVGHGAVLVDVRTAENRERTGRLPAALEISLNVLEWRLDPDSPSRHPQAPGLDDLVILVCEQGYSSSLAAHRLQQLGFTRATDVVGGFDAWVTADLPVEG